MSAFAVWFAGLIACSAGAFLCWLIWSLCWDIYDHLMQKRTRRKNGRFDVRVGKDCRDIRRT